MGILLQACEYGTDMASYLEEFRFVDAFQCAFSGIGIPVAGLLLMAAIFVPLFVRTRSPVIPLVLLVLTGGAFVSTIAPVWTSIGAIVLLTVGAGAVVLIYARYSD